MKKKIKEVSDFMNEGYSGLTALELYEAQFFTPEECIAMCTPPDDYLQYKKNKEYEEVYDNED